MRAYFKYLILFLNLFTIVFTEQEIIIGNRILESKGIEFHYILGSMYYYGEGREQNIKLGKEYLKNYADNFSWSSESDSDEIDEMKSIAKENILLDPKSSNKIVSSITSDDKTVSATLYESSIKYCSLSWSIGCPSKLSILEVETPKSIITFNNFELGEAELTPPIGGLQFFDNEYLLVYASTITYGLTFVININTLDIREIAQGYGKIISYDDNEGVVKIGGQKHYYKCPPCGAFWVDALYDFEGNLLKFLSVQPRSINDQCVLIKDIIDIKKHQFFMQKPDDCINVFH